MAGVIYQIENQENGKRYIGSAVNLSHRQRQHLHSLRHGQHGNRHLQRAFDKYGEEAFEFTTLEDIEDTSLLVPREQCFLDSLKPEYNIAQVAGSSLGIQRTEETRRRVSEAHKGQRPSNYGKHASSATRKKLSEAHMGQHPPNYGKSASLETRRKQSEAQKGMRASDETRAKMSVAQRARRAREGGHTNTETLARMRAAWTPERKQAQSDRLRGKPLSEEHKQNIGKANRGKRAERVCRRRERS